jgi:hypothetical protein
LERRFAFGFLFPIFVLSEQFFDEFSVLEFCRAHHEADMGATRLKYDYSSSRQLACFERVKTNYKDIEYPAGIPGAYAKKDLAQALAAQ